MEENAFIHYDGQFCFEDETPFQPLVLLDGPQENSWYNAIAIPVSLLPDSSLSFEKEFSAAREAHEKGLKIVFDLDLGLFDRLKMPLESNALYSMLIFAMEAFKTKLLEPFSSITLGVIAYKGSADFYRSLKKDFSLAESLLLWLESAYDRPLDPFELEKTDEGRLILMQAYFEMGIRFIESVTQPLPGQIPVFVLLDFFGIENSALSAFMLNRERLGRVLFVPKEPHYYGMGWDQEIEAPFACFGSKRPLIKQKNSKVYGLMVPSVEKKELSAYKEIGEAIDFFKKNTIPFRLIPESLFVSEWDEVALLFVPKNLSKEALRMIKGYLASQGEIIALGPSPEIPQAVEFNEWKRTGGMQ